MVAIIDYGIGNLLAIQNIVHKVGGKAIITSDAAEIRKCEKLILPGVGAFGYGMDQLRSRSLIELLHEEVLIKQKLTLGLCLGAQLMTKGSEEGNSKGLGWVEASTIRFDSSYSQVIPHMGWTDVKFSPSSLLGAGFDETRFYFTHSYHFLFENEQDVKGVASYGYEFPCYFEVKNILGVQFHPEKSHAFGMKFFKNFLKL